MSMMNMLTWKGKIMEMLLMKMLLGCLYLRKLHISLVLHLKVMDVLILELKLLF